MIVNGKIIYDGPTKLYSVALPLLALWTQGSTLDDAIDMAEDGLVNLYPNIKFEIFWVSKAQGSFCVTTLDKQVIPIILKEARLASGLTLIQVAKKLGYSNQNSIFAYEKGTREPSVSKFEELLKIYGIALGMHKKAA